MIICYGCHALAARAKTGFIGYGKLSIAFPVFTVMSPRVYPFSRRKHTGRLCQVALLLLAAQSATDPVTNAVLVRNGRYYLF